MGRHVALLRGVNVGGRNKVAMAPLRELVSGLGFAEVRTYLQSGNVVVEAGERSPEETAAVIEEGLERHLGRPVSVVVRTAAELAGVLADDPLGEVATDPARHLVTFLATAPSPDAAVALGVLDPASHLPERFHLSGREIHTWHPDGVHGTKLTDAFWRRQLGMVGTARNWRTVEALVGLAKG